MGQRRAEHLAGRPVAVGYAVAGGMHESAVRQGRARPDGDIPGTQRLPGLAKRLLPGIVQARPEPFGCDRRFPARIVAFRHRIRTYRHGLAAVATRTQPVNGLVMYDRPPSQMPASSRIPGVEKT